MGAYIPFVVLLILGGIIAKKVVESGFDNLRVKREINKSKVFINEVFEITTIIENKKSIPISFITIEEEYSAEVKRLYTNERLKDKSHFYYSSYSISGNERIKRTYKTVASKRGVYILKNMNISIGDYFGYALDNRAITSLLEIVVYPKVLDLKDLNLNNNSLQGEEVVKRWIYRDPLYVKGIREYTMGDRMKDIHWNSSMKMNKLMVKEYDTTSEKKVMFIFSNQNTTPFWSIINTDCTERGIELIMALGKAFIKNAVPVSISTNSQIINMYEASDIRIFTYTNDFSTLLEIGARIDIRSRGEFHRHLRGILRVLDRNTIYIVVAAFLDEESIGIIGKINSLGFTIKIIDTSKDEAIPKLPFIETISYKGGR
ncbi:DUF58 domain-containing protein [Clostridium sp.]|uniref:DUF58 domain-containing protein n=1 Tax=Clostridium sp. TaxID=1506 RepID=UPI003463DBA4